MQKILEFSSHQNKEVSDQTWFCSETGWSAPHTWRRRPSGVASRGCPLFPWPHFWLTPCGAGTGRSFPCLAWTTCRASWSGYGTAAACAGCCSVWRPSGLVTKTICVCLIFQEVGGGTEGQGGLEPSNFRYSTAHRIRVSVIRRKIYQCWNWYGSDLQTLDDQANQVLKKFHDVDLR